ncbi:hypothetical protein [Absidia glauca]|uniref:PIN domain-containing protein n=1 Tax=Absidia glauca TaxID=4829 RepID=A0A168KK49_ABSGL|nr:hypothetical protein [Absidia glauca]
MDSLMDVDGPEFILEVNEAIAAVRLKKTGETYETFSHNSSVALILELDGLKNNKRRSSNGVDRLEDHARKAMRFLEATFQRKSSALRGQRSDEAFDRDSSQKVAGDDRILDCCLYFRYHLEKSVLLLSNDRNLSIKALVHHIDALSAESKSRMVELLDLVSKGQKGMMIDPPFTRNSDYIIDEDEDMMDIEEISGSHESTVSSGTSLSRYAGPAPTKALLESRQPAIIPSRSHWHNEYYRRGMDLKKK